jgi:hypothetical protein
MNSAYNIWCHPGALLTGLWLFGGFLLSASLWFNGLPMHAESSRAAEFLYHYDRLDRLWLSGAGWR